MIFFFSQVSVLSYWRTLSPLRGVEVYDFAKPLYCGTVIRAWASYFSDGRYSDTKYRYSSSIFMIGRKYRYLHQVVVYFDTEPAVF